ncbi:hypothetical protein K7640_24110 [Micromonospora sp. PLK6-60]|uniref:DUF6767 domain-containing protein n=1 Tax=Micromonospora sp. PLK6-60 TaxID=2873383 RepID=UPI001CA60879|nr:DUF6767 domain-containing protein [Micromonospora sp. PLK6-60]MBY8874917.1 hypothetical protein [Micromonospora sp. PLK6-60]
MPTTTSPPRPGARCPIRPGQPCTLCQLDVTGPQDCPLVWLVMGDDELREGVRRAGGRPERTTARRTRAGS